LGYYTLTLVIYVVNDYSLYQYILFTRYINDLTLLFVKWFNAGLAYCWKIISPQLFCSTIKKVEASIRASLDNRNVVIYNATLSQSHGAAGICLFGQTEEKSN